MECCTMHLQTCQNPVTSVYNLLAAVSGGARLNHKLTLIFGLLSYIPMYKITSSKEAHTANHKLIPYQFLMLTTCFGFCET
jgi:hypothetical protein